MLTWDIFWSFYCQYWKIPDWKRAHPNKTLSVNNEIFIKIWNCPHWMSHILMLCIPTTINYPCILYLPIRACYLFPLSCCFYFIAMFFIPGDALLIKNSLLWFNAMLFNVWIVYFGAMSAASQKSISNRRDRTHRDLSGNTPNSLTNIVKLFDAALYLTIHICWAMNISAYHGTILFVFCFFFFVFCVQHVFYVVILSFFPCIFTNKKH